MTFNQFKNELDYVTSNRRAMRSILKQLATLADDRLSTLGPGAIDYSKEHLQSTHDPDGATINAIAKIDEDTAKLNDKLQRLREKNEYYESLILSVDGIEGEIVRLKVIEGLQMRIVAQHLHYSPAHCWKLYSETLTILYEREEAKCQNQ